MLHYQRTAHDNAAILRFPYQAGTIPIHGSWITEVSLKY